MYTCSNYSRSAGAVVGNDNGVIVIDFVERS